MVAGAIASNISAEATTPTGNTLAEAMGGRNSIASGTRCDFRHLGWSPDLKADCHRANAQTLVQLNLFTLGELK